MNRGGARPNAGRPPGQLPRYTPAEARAILSALLAPGETWADLARRIGVPRQAVSRAICKGATVVGLGRWVRLAQA
jgi:transposase-like protein